MIANSSLVKSPMVLQEVVPAHLQREHLLIELAVRNPHHRHLEDWPATMQNEIHTHFESYEQACQEADALRQQLIQPGAIATVCANSPLGKHLPNALYVHTGTLTHLDPLLCLYEKLAHGIAGNIGTPTLIKFQTDQPKLSYLFYPDFDRDPHPALQTSIQVDLATLEVNYRDYSDTPNPPVLHRKETFVTPDYSHYDEFAELTHQEEVLGLLDITRGIGTKDGWQQRLNLHRLSFEGHHLVCRLDSRHESFTIQIDRHKAAMVRMSLSRPVRLALEAGLFTPETSFFDYGCGYGGDVHRIADQGYPSAGWDPYYAPEVAQRPADIVNLGYVINVIEDTAERREALSSAWELTQQVLIVAAQVLVNDRQRGLVAYGDGIITNRNTFQKYYEQEELKIYIDQVLNVDSIPIGLGIYLVFRDNTQAENFRASRFRSYATTPRVRVPTKRFEDYQEILTPLMEFVTQRGRLPHKEELSPSIELPILSEFHTFRRAFQVILQVTDAQEWDHITSKRRSDLLLYLALSRFSSRPKPAELSIIVKEDIKSLFGSYRQACFEADKMLFTVGNLNQIAQRCQNSPIGKKVSTGLWVHISALEHLDPLLRLYEGCASRTIGRMEDVTVIKFHTKTPKISYLFYPDFDEDPHPALHTSMQIDLRDLHVSYRDYDQEENPPILHQKDELVTSDYPLYEKFEKLSRQEQNWGLFDDFSLITNRQGWLKCLQEHCAEIIGHRLVWRKDADPYKMKIQRSIIRTHQAKTRHGKVNEVRLETVSESS
jgi:DNA phosphorothioation-associated putative methyltransferase